MSRPAPAGAAPSFWLEEAGWPLPARPPLEGDLDVDVAIVGAGYSGLWTAYYLLEADPGLRVALLERESAGYGASGRNGGWCAALFATSYPALARRYGIDAASELRLALQDAVDEVGRRAAAEGIDCDFAKGGTVDLVRSPAQLERARHGLAEARAIGIGEADLALLGAEEATALVHASGVLAALYSPHCAAIQPARLVRGLAAAVERRGATIYERTAVSEVAAEKAVTASGTVRAEVVVVATEGYGGELAGQRRRLAPVYSLMLVTEPLDDERLAAVGLDRRPTFSDHRHLVIYGQRTAGGRIAFGGRGAPYHYGSAVRPAFDRDPRVHRLLETTLVDLLPALEGVRFTHHWGGALGIPRDWHPSVGLDAERKIGWIGGYVGDGVACANLGGRTLAELITGTTSPRTGLCWVGHRSPRWEREPLRYLGVNAGLVMMSSADRAEQRRGRPARRARWFGRLLGE